MSEYKEILIPACKVKINRGRDIEVIPKIKAEREPLRKRFGWDRNDPKIGVISFEHLGDHSVDPLFGSEIELKLTLGITKLDDNWSQENLYPKGDPLEVFDKTSGKYANSDSFHRIFSARLDEGAYVHFSTFELVLAYEGNKKDFDKTFALLVKKVSKTGQQRGTISLANQGVELRWVQREGKRIEEIPIDTEYFTSAQKYDATTTLKLDEEQVVGHRDLGIGVMPGSIDAGGMLVAEVSDIRKLERAYEDIQKWKKPMVIPTSELSDYLRSGDVDVNSLLEEDCLGKIIHYRGLFGKLYEDALRNSA